MKPEPRQALTGSYRCGEVDFLLRPINVAPTPLAERERLIQSGARHYSEMIGPEDRPTKTQLIVFRHAMAANARRLAQDLCKLADALAHSARDARDLTLVSIARAGTPIGVLLLHRLRNRYPAWRVRHFSISVIRDRGMDLAALRWIRSSHPPASVRFVDGWTGKGTIANEIALEAARSPEVMAGVLPGLWTPVDMCGAAFCSAGWNDYLIPNAVLGGTVSGMLSRSVMPREMVSEGTFHGCVELQHLKRYDLSRWFVDEVGEIMRNIPTGDPAALCTADTERQQRACLELLESMLSEWAISDRNRIKLGLGETVRVLLRRVPRVILLDPSAPAADRAMVTRLSEARGVPVVPRSCMAALAVAIIADAKSQEFQT